MKIEVAKAALLEGLQKVQNIVSLRSTLPILSNVLVSATKEGLTLTTTDLEVSVRCTVEANVQKVGATTLPARRLSSIVRELPDSVIQIDVDDKDIGSITCGSSFFKIIGLSEDEFPPLPKADGKNSYTLDQGAFREMLRKSSYAASADETRYVLNGVFLSFKGGKLTMVATDGRRLALVEQEVDFPSEGQADYILPTKAVNELMHILREEGELKIHASESQILFEFADAIVASKLIDGTYPNYKQVIPAQCEERVTIERESLLGALRRVSLVTTDKSNAAKLTFAKNKLAITMTTPDIGEARETIPVKYTGKELSVAFNPEYMMDPLKSLSNDEIAIELTDELSPGVIKTDIPFLYVLMPMRIS
ncbi:MAG: DNA polymerase III subunit beta [Verrucomicrobia bacterium]|nr:DNA polymerase III subunit beta [Verrucomicrobiota bacterium]